MSEHLIKVKYQCLHPSCQVFCRRGELTLERSQFDWLLTAFSEENKFKSPRGVCKLGFSQPFKTLAVTEVSAQETEASVEVSGKGIATDPIELLKKEHQEILKKLDFIESQIRKRDINGLWESTAAVQNDIIRHSIRKEEGVLFPIILKKASQELTFIQIVYEDHKEFLSLLHSFRAGLQEDEILDGIVNSLIVNLRNHIRKEDDEFFAMMEWHLTAEDKRKIIEQMNKVESEFVPEGAGDRSEKVESPYLENRKRLDAEIRHAKHESIKDDWSCH
jgi:hemerythrin-like domain-containing protein